MRKSALSGSHDLLPFTRWCYSEKRNRDFLWIALTGTVVQFAVFKLLYPFADFFGDSYSYIYAAAARLEINIWPIGYSWFLRAVHAMTHSDTILVALQYFFLESAALFFFFTFLYFFRPAGKTQNILFVFLFFNPLFLYLSNYVNSDPLFAALSLLWFSELIRIVLAPRPYLLLTQAILLFLAFTVRHNAMYYPVLTALAFALSRQSLRRKLVGSALGLALVVPFVFHERAAAYQMYGVKEFSPMTGWLLANNALYMRGHIAVNLADLPSPESRELDTLAADFFRRAAPDFDGYLTDYVANFFIRQPEAPLKRYVRHHYRPVDEYGGVATWGKASVIFADYGGWLMKHYPLAFARYFLLRNSGNYFLPPLEKLEVYNLGSTEVWPIARDWFDYPSVHIRMVSIEAQGMVLLLYPAFFLLVNLYCLAGGAWLAMNRHFRTGNSPFRRVWWLLIALLVINAGFSILATINVFRYQFFPMLIYFSFSLIMMESINKKYAL